MSNQSVLSEFISRLNVAKAGHFLSINVIETKIVLKVLNMFEELGIIRGFILKDDKNIEVFLKYSRLGYCTFRSIRVVSTPGLRKYVNLQQLYALKSETGKNSIFIISTQEGLLFDYECFLRRTSGEVLVCICI